MFRGLPDQADAAIARRGPDPLHSYRRDADLGYPMIGWKTRQLSDTVHLVETVTNPALLIGTITYRDGTFRVEIMWTGPGGDYHFDSKKFDCCIAYIDGIEETQRRFLGHDPNGAVLKLIQEKQREKA